MKGYKKCAADQFLGRCLIVNELSSRPLDQVNKPQSQLPLTIKYKWVFWAALLLSQLSGSIDIFLAGPFAKLLNLGNPETLFCQFKTVGVLRIEVFVIVGSWFNRAGSYLFRWQVFQNVRNVLKCFKIFSVGSWFNRAHCFLFC